MSKYIKVEDNFPNGTSPEAVLESLESRFGVGNVSGIETIKNNELEFTAIAKVKTQESNIKEMEDFDQEYVAIHFGCRVSRDRFHGLYKFNNATMKAKLKYKKLHFFISHLDNPYMLELDRDNIKNTCITSLLSSNSQVSPAKFVVFQLSGGPRIYKKATRDIDIHHMDPHVDGWFRTTDFTPECSIGQSSHVCLQFQVDVNLSEFARFFPNCWIDTRETEIVEGHGFCDNLELVPQVHPTLNLPYNIIFKISDLVQCGLIPGPLVGDEFFRLCDPQAQTKSSTKIEYILEKFKLLKTSCYDPVQLLRDKYKQYDKCITQLTPSSSDHVVYLRKVYVTPSKIYFRGPQIGASNGVLRNYSRYTDNFLRVSFVDEEGKRIGQNDVSIEIKERILSILVKGIQIGEKRFEFLAFSSSQLQDGSLWMFAPIDGLDADKIRKWMGDFSNIRSVAKYAARLGQSLSSSRKGFRVEKEETETIPDIEVIVDGGAHIFSDGIGKISSAFAVDVARECDYSYVPSAFQIRYGGYKGVVAVDPKSSKRLSLRESMHKFESKENRMLNILEVTRHQPLYINRQLITLLSSLKIKDDIFEKKYEEALKLLGGMLTEPRKAKEALTAMPSGVIGKIMIEMLSCGYRPDAEPLVSRLIQTFRAEKLLGMLRNTRIFVHDGRIMMGCLDETGQLNYGQVFVQFSVPDTPKKTILTDKVMVAKSPCIHPGDVRVLTAVDVQDLHHMVDCIVFPQKGQRPHPNECSGSDLDGDEYVVCWDPDLIPPMQVEPMDYTPAPLVQLDRDVTIQDVVEHFTNYVGNSTIGFTSSNHLALADSEPDKALSKKCLDLAKIISEAVDAPKSGAQVEIPQHLIAPRFPDYMERPYNVTYKSDTVIGKIYRDVKGKVQQTVDPVTFDILKEQYDADMEINGFSDYTAEASQLKDKYDEKLKQLMDYYGIQTEAEVLLGVSIRSMSKCNTWNDASSIALALEALRKEAREWFYKDSGNHVNYEAKASAWYHVTYHHEFWDQNTIIKEGPFFSFPWSVHEKLIEIKKRKTNMVA